MKINLPSSLSMSFSYSALAGVTSAVISILTVRLFGSYPFSSYVTDLAILSLVLVILELIPSNLTLFKVQDDYEWLGVIRLQTAINIILVTCTFLIIWLLGDIFSAFSWWMLLYALSNCTKRYLDIRLQSLGRLPEFIRLDFFASIFRLFLLFLAFYTMMTPTNAIWASLSLGLLLPQLFWFHLNRGELVGLISSFNIKAINIAWVEKRQFMPYYPGIILKRLKESIVPIGASKLIGDADVLAGFFIIYKGALAVFSQVRVIEAFANYRASLNLIKNNNLIKCFIAITAQLLAILAAMAMAYFSGIKSGMLITSFVISFLAWPLVFRAQIRAEVLGSYKMNLINKSLLIWNFLFVLALVFINLTGYSSTVFYSLVIVIIEFLSLLYLYKAFKNA